MQKIIEMAHSLGRAEAKRRMQAGVGKLAQHIPGGVAEVASSWPAEDRMAVDVTAMGQKVATLLDVEDRLVRVTLTLPPMLSFMAPAIEAVVRKRGEAMLLPDGTGKA